MATNSTRLNYCTVKSDVAYVYGLHPKAKKVYRATCAAFVTLHPKAYRPTAAPWCVIESINDNKYTALVSFYDAKSAEDCNSGNLIMRIRFRHCIGWEQETWDQFEQLVIKFVDYESSEELNRTAVNLIKSVLNATK